MAELKVGDYIMMPDGKYMGCLGKVSSGLKGHWPTYGRYYSVTCRKKDGTWTRKVPLYTVKVRGIKKFKSIEEFDAAQSEIESTTDWLGTEMVPGSWVIACQAGISYLGEVSSMCVINQNISVMVNLTAMQSKGKAKKVRQGYKHFKVENLTVIEGSSAMMGNIKWSKT